MSHYIYGQIAAYGPCEPGPVHPFHEPLSVLIYTRTMGCYEMYSIKYLLQCYDVSIDDKQLKWRPKATEDKYRSGKPGKMMRQMFPHLEDHDLESIQNELRSQYMVDRSEWEVRDDTDFGNVCRMDDWAATLQLDTTRDCKLQEDSCMRYDFEQFSAHPMEAYDSGDFRILSVRNEDDEIVARSVYRVSNRTRGPVYCSSQPSYEHLIDHCDEHDITKAHDGDWVGAKLVWQEEDSDECSGPYIDVAPQYGRYDPADDPSHFYIVNYGDGNNMDLSDHEGTLTANLRRCNCCDECTTRNNMEDGFCESCRDSDQVEPCCLSHTYYEIHNLTQLHNGEYIHTRYVETRTVEVEGELYLKGAEPHVETA